MSEELLSAVRIVGLSHMVVVSGYHLAVVVNQSKRLLGKVSRAAIIIGAFAIILLFISIAGFSASMMRAGIMTMISLSAWYFGRKIHPGRILLYVASASLLRSPNLFQNIAWQLSFMSYMGIVFFSPILTSFLYGESKTGFLSSNIITSISAQITCLPISIYNFGSFSIVGFLAVLLTTSTVPFIMALTLVSAIIPPIAIVAKVLISYHLFVISALSQNTWAIVNLPNYQPAVFLLYLPIIIIFIALKIRTNYDFRPRYTLDK